MGPLSQLLHLTENDNIDRNLRVSAFIENKKWNFAKLRTYIHDPDILNRIRGIPIPLSDISDSYFWGGSGSGSFTTQSATWLAHNIDPKGPLWPFHWIWNIDTMLR